jgi:5'-deoxynucleotidase YfbR-like HD superfamily hydrolase
VVPDRPRAEDVDLHDIAHNLALQVRFNGSCGPYTVAEHSVHRHDEAARLGLDRDWRYLALLHDAHEAYIGDIVTPVAAALDVIVDEQRGHDKAIYTALKSLRIRHDQEIFTALGLDWSRLPGAAYAAVKRIDAAAMMTDRDALASKQPEDWGMLEKHSRLPFTPQCWDFHKARREFLERLALYDARALKTIADIDIGFAAWFQEGNPP